MMSSLATGRSANRGLCAQPCRLPHDLVDEEGNVVEAPGNTRPLCPKDYCTVDHLQEMIDAGVGSLKVEGRMKAPDYVYNVVGAYREAIDATLAGHQLDAAEDLTVHRRLKRAFNRDFTDAYLMGTSGDEMMSYDRSNNRGEVVGTVASSRALEDRVARRGGGNGGRQRTRRYTQAEAVISLTEPVEKGDLLELRPVDDPSQFLTVHAEADAPAGATITCLASRPVPAGSIVSVIRSQNAIDAAARAAAADVSRRRPVTVRVVARLGQPFRVELACADGEATAAAEGFVVEAARTRPVSQEDLVEHVGRMGGGPFEPVSFDVEMDEGCGMGFSAVHKVRAQAVKSLVEALLAPYGERQAATAPVPSDQLREERREAVRVEAGVPAAADVEPVEPCACVLVADPECARAALEAGAERVYATVDDLAHGDWPEGVIPWLDEVCREADHARLDPWVRQGEPVAVGNISELALAAERGAAAEVRPCIPVHNKSALLAMEAAGAKAVWLSCELTLEEACELARAASVPVGLSVLGRERAMTSEHCVLQALGRCVHNCEKCPQRARRLSLKDIDGNLLPVRTDVNGRSRIWAAHPLDATPQADQLVEAGVRWLLADCTLLGPKETTFAVERVCRAIAAAKAGRRPAARLAGATSGHLFAGIG